MNSRIQEITKEVSTIRRRVTELQRETLAELQKEITALTCASVSAKNLAGLIDDLNALQGE